MPDIMAACNDTNYLSVQEFFPPFSTLYYKISKATEYLCFWVILQDLINLTDFIKRKMPVFILLGSFIAPFFPTCIILGQFAALSQ